MSQQILDLRGIYPPVPTAFKDSGDVYGELFSKNIEKLNQYDLRGYVVLGSNGEYVLLSEKEKLDLLESARKTIPENRLLIAGTGCQSTIDTLNLTKEASILGVDAALVVNPSYYKNMMTDDALKKHFYSVADGSKIPVLIYNVPPYTGIDLSAETIASIAEHPNIIGMKDSGSDLVKLGNVMRLAKPGFQILSGSASLFLPALSIGIVGGIFALANIAPAQCLEIYRKFLDGDTEKARDLQIRMIPVNSAVTARWGVPGLKAAMDMLGLYGGPVRMPLLQVSEKIKAEIEKILENAELKKIG